MNHRHVPRLDFEDPQRQARLTLYAKRAAKYLPVCTGRQTREQERDWIDGDVAPWPAIRPMETAFTGTDSDND
ncbi:MAG: hypothetical protein V2A79_14800 [Planctomycetota bacterium]